MLKFLIILNFKMIIINYLSDFKIYLNGSFLGHWGIVKVKVGRRDIKNDTFYWINTTEY